MRFLFFIVGLVSLINTPFTGASELLISSNFPIPGTTQIVDYKGKYISVIDSNTVYSTDYMKNNDMMIVNNNNFTIQTNYTQPVGSTLWNLDTLDGSLDRAYHYFYTGKNVTAYVIDSGVISSSEFGNRLQKGMSFNPYNASTTDCLGHGSHVASLLGSKTYGVAKNITIVPVKVFNCISTTTAGVILQGIYWVIAQPTKGIVNLSLGGNYNQVINMGIKDLVDAGFIVVVAGGNNGADACNYSPSSEKSAIVTGCSDVNNGVCLFSNEGMCITLFAPGDSILGLSNIPGIQSIKSGTSMSSPHVAGVAATLYEKYPGINQSTMKKLLMSMAANNTLNPLTFTLITPSPNLELRGILSNSSLKCYTIPKNTCGKHLECSYIPNYGCRVINFCGFRTKKECSSHKRCKFASGCKLKTNNAS
jgi:subtilisin family serine protease